MPFVNIKVAGPTLACEQIARLQRCMSDLIVGVLDRAVDATSVLVEQPAIGGWAVGGRPALVAAHVDARITAGTATPAQKTAFIQAANGLLKQVLGADLAIATYVSITEIPGDAWGYDGVTQAERLGRSNATASS